MRCLNCGKNIVGSAQKKFCDDSCRKAFARKMLRIVGQENYAKLKNSDRLEKITPGYPYKVIDKTVYNRRAVIYPHEENGVINSLGATWKTRPEPENSDDIPDKDNRCIYKRKDGSRYLIDVLGNFSAV